MLLQLRPAAALDIEKAATWYEGQYAGLGSRFIAELERIEARIVENPYQFPVAFRNTRRALLSRFPYAVYFQIRRDVALVLRLSTSEETPRDGDGAHDV